MIQATFQQPYATTQTNINALHLPGTYARSALRFAETIAASHGTTLGAVRRETRHAKHYALRSAIANALANRGYRTNVIARVLGREVSTVRGYLRGGGA